MTRAPDPRVALAVALVLSAIVGGCRPGLLRPTLPAALPSPAQLLAAVAARRAAVNSVRGFAQIAYESGRDSVGARHAVVATRPDRFRLEVLSPLGTLAVVTCDGHDLVVYARRENVIYRGAATAGSVGAYTAVPVPVADVVAILLGGPPERTAVGPARVVRDDAAGRVRLSIPLSEGSQEIWFVPEAWLPVASETPLPDGRTLRVDFADYHTLGNVAFPYRVEMRAAPGDRVVRVHYGAPSLNDEIAGGLFTLASPPGVKELAIQDYAPGDAS